MGKHLDKNRIKVPTQFNKRFAESLGQNVPEQVPGFNSEVKHHVQRIKKTLVRSGELIEQIEQVRKANKNDPTQNDIAAQVNTWKYAQKKLSEIESLIVKPIKDGDGEGSDLADKIENYIDSQLSESAAKGSFAKELRQHIRSMDKSERSKKVLKLINEGKQREAKWILGAGQELSGLSEASYKSSKSHYKKTFHKEQTKAAEELRNLNNMQYKGYQKAKQIVSDLNTRKVQEASSQAEKAQQAMNQ